MNKWVLEQINPETSLEATIANTEAVLLQAHHKETGFLGKDNNVRKNGKK